MSDQIFYYCPKDQLDLENPKKLAKHIVKEHPDLAQRIIADTAKMFKYQQLLTDSWFHQKSPRPNQKDRRG